MSKHHPGPWRSDEEGLTIYAGDVKICDVRDVVERQKANVRLMRLSPEMFAALKAAAETLDRYAELEPGGEGEPPHPNAAMHMLNHLRDIIEKVDPRQL